jgi:hypothetical protein
VVSSPRSRITNLHSRSKNIKFNPFVLGKRAFEVWTYILKAETSLFATATVLSSYKLMTSLE